MSISSKEVRAYSYWSMLIEKSQINEADVKGLTLQIASVAGVFIKIVASSQEKQKVTR